MAGMTPGQVAAVLAEAERRWRARTPAKGILDVMPECRVPRSEFRLIIRDLGFGPGEPIGDDEWDRAVFEMFDRLRKEFPDEIWEPAKSWTAATVERRKQLGLVGRPRFRTRWGKS